MILSTLRSKIIEQDYGTVSYRYDVKIVDFTFLVQCPKLSKITKAADRRKKFLTLRFDSIYQKSRFSWC